eukprot:scaffold51553_cov30-Tisochrysis_lutea.AAC.5
MANSKSSAGAAGVLADSVSGSKVTHIGDRERCLLKDVAGVQVGVAKGVRGGNGTTWHGGHEKREQCAKAVVNRPGVAGASSRSAHLCCGDQVGLAAVDRLRKLEKVLLKLGELAGPPQRLCAHLQMIQRAGSRTPKTQPQLTRARENISGRHMRNSAWLLRHPSPSRRKRIRLAGVQ